MSVTPRTRAESAASRPAAEPRPSAGRRSRFGPATLIGIVVALLLVAGVPMLPGWIIFLLTVAFAKALVVLGVVLLLRADLVSFGHGLFYAGGAYAVALSIRNFGIRDALPLVLIGTLACTLLAAVLGLFIARYRGIFFGMLTTAFAMILYSLLVKFYWASGGTDGISVQVRTTAGLEPTTQGVRLLHYWFVLLFLGIALFVSYRVVRSPLGYLMRAIFDNEIRVEYMGASVRRAIYRTYLLSGALGGLGGALTAVTVGHVAPDMAYWTVSGEFVFIALLGGIGSVFAPVVAAVIFEFVRSYAQANLPYTWQLILGGTLLVIILFAPGGIWSFVERFTSKRHTPTIGEEGDAA
jgi:branched-chain amino acid transport system permease protein